MDSNGSVPNSYLNNIATTINSQISSLNSQVATKAPAANPTLTGTVKVPNSNSAGTALNTIIALASDSTGGFRASTKLGNGLIINIGRRTGITSDGTYTVNFKTAFSSASSYCICKNYMSTKDTNAKDAEISFFSKAAGSAKTYIAKTDTSSFEYIAIGY